MVFRKSYISILVLITLAIWLAVGSIDKNLHIIACDIGQGDAILVQKSSTQILIDSGPNKKVLECLGKHMPFWDKKIELAILTHVDKDHSGGFLEIYKSYKIENFLTNDLSNPVFSTQTSQLLQNLVKNPIFPNDGMIIRVGMIYLDILHPDSGFYSSKTNDYSIVNVLRYGDFKAIFTGDLELDVSEKLFENNKIGKVKYIKIAHHGSKNGTSNRLLEYIEPELAIISSGKNSYGHPSPEVLKILEANRVKVLRTDEKGDVEVVTNGKSYWTK